MLHNSYPNSSRELWDSLVSRFSLVSCGHTLPNKTRHGTGEELYDVLVEAQERQEQGYLHVATQFEYFELPLNQKHKGTKLEY